MTLNKKRWAFFSYAHNLGDFTRALETAKGIDQAGQELCFFNHGGTHINMISIPYLKIPRVTMVPTTLCPAFYKKKLATFPNTMERNLFSRYLIPGFLKRKFFNSVMLKDILKDTVTNFNEVRKYYGLPPIYNSTDFVKSDLVLLPDLPELSGLPEDDLPSPYKYTGPIFSKMDIDLPEKINQVFSRKGTNVFCSLGSSGSPEILRIIISTLRKKTDFNVVCATTTILEPESLGPESENFFAAKFIPAHLANEMADIAFIHGGQGTIQTAVWSGTPIVGIGFQSEQQANIDGLVRAGMGKRIKLYQVNEKSILKSVLKISKPTYKTNALRMQKLVRSTDGVKKSVELMNTLIS